MKQILACLFLVLLFSAPCFAQVGGGAALLQSGGEGADYSDIIFWWRAEAADFSGTNGTDDYSAGDDVVSLNNATIGTCGKTNNGLCGGGSSYYGEVDTSGADIFDGSSGCIAFWANTTTFNTAGRYWRWYGDSDNYLYVRDSTSDANDIQVAWRGNAEADTWTVTDSDMSTATWYFIEFCYDCSQAGGSDTIELHVYDTSGSEVGSGVSSSAETCSVIDTTVDAGSNNIRMNNSDPNDPKDADLDNFMTSNDPNRDFHALRDTDGYPG